MRAWGCQGFLRNILMQFSLRTIFALTAIVALLAALIYQGPTLPSSLGTIIAAIGLALWSAQERPFLNEARGCVLIVAMFLLIVGVELLALSCISRP